MTSFDADTGAFTYKAGFSGPDSFTFLVSDGQATAVEAGTVDLSFGGANFNGTWQTAKVTHDPDMDCSGTTFTISSPASLPLIGKVALNVSARTAICGSTSLTFPVAHVGVDASTDDGYKYSESYTTPCIGNGLLSSIME